ncbi:MAG: hypothetical protein D6768_03815, partial [Chloroflexi bacterium]
MKQLASAGLIILLPALLFACQNRLTISNEQLAISKTATSAINNEQLAITKTPTSAINNEQLAI